jgi:hypothetical protein
MKRLLAVASLTLACSLHAQVTSVRQIEGADPQRDFKAAIARGDFRFVAVNGFVGGVVPGTDQSGTDRALIAAHGKRTIQGTSDYMDARLHQLAWKYAETYNGLLLEHLRKKQPKT